MAYSQTAPGMHVSVAANTEMFASEEVIMLSEHRHIMCITAKHSWHIIGDTTRNRLNIVETNSQAPRIPKADWLAWLSLTKLKRERKVITTEDSRYLFS